MASRKVHAVVCAYPALGHINPMMHLSTLLAARGIRVTFVSTDFYCDRLRRKARRRRKGKGQAEEEAVAEGAKQQGQGQEGEDASRQGQGQGKGLEEEEEEEAIQHWHRQDEKVEEEGQGQVGEYNEEEEGSIRFEGLCDGLPPDFDRSSLSTQLCRAVDQLHSAFAELVRCLLHSTSPPPSLLISDAFLPWTHDVASALLIPRALFWPQSIAVFTIFAHTDLLLTNDINPFQETTMTVENVLGLKNSSRQGEWDSLGRCQSHNGLPFELPKSSGAHDHYALDTAPTRVIDFIPGVPALPTSHLPHRVKPVGGQDRRFLLYENLANQSKQCKEVSWILANSFNNLEGHLLKVLQNNVGISMKLVGPLLPLPYKEEQPRGCMHTGGLEDILQWLNTRAVASVLYICLGSVVTWTMAQVEEVGLGLMAMKQAFLWVMRPWEMRLALPQGLLKFGRIVKFAPQLQVLGHPAIGGFMSHCGWNSTLESLSMGVPMLAWPHFLDQFTNCWYVVHVWKIGVELLVVRREGLEEAIIERSEFERAVELLMQAEDGRLMRLRASKLGDSAGDSVLLGSSCRNLEVFLSELATESIAT